MVLACFALLLQEDWARPVELDRGKTLIPWTFQSDGDRIALVSFHLPEPKSMRLVVHSSADGGSTWKRPIDADFGKTEGPPAALVLEEKIHVLFPAKGSPLHFWSFDLNSGTATRALPIEIPGVEKIEDDIWPALLHHDQALYGSCAQVGGRPNRLLVLRSPDLGKTWSVVSDPSWKTHTRGDGMRPLIFSAGGSLHVLFNETKELDSIRHLSSSDGGKIWSPRETVFGGKDPKVFPLAVGTDGVAACVVYGSFAESKRRAVLHTAVTADGGKTWSRGGDLFETRIDDPSAFCGVSVRGDRMVFSGVRIDPEDKDRQIRAVVRRSDDAGKSWRDLGLSKGMNRHNVAAIGTLTPDGRNFLAAFMNVENPAGWLKGWNKESAFLVRRWGAEGPPPDAPLTDAEKAKIHGWIDQLENDDIQVREKASKDLLGFGERALPVIRETLERTSDPEVKSRLEEIRTRIVPVWWKG